MTDPDPPGQPPSTWPPAITVPIPVLPDPKHRCAARLGKASLWAAGAGVACWGAAGAAFAAAPFFVFHRIVISEDAWVHTGYFAGLACEAAGIGLGIFGRRVKAGRAGLGLSFCVLCAMVSFTLVLHQGYSDSHGRGGWIWDPNEGDNSICDCDGGA